MLKSIFRILSLASLFWVAAASAATIEKSSNSYCRVEISGEIIDSDFERFLQVAESALPGFDGESTAKDVVCLDSPGGSLTEGVKFARYFYTNGSGTVIDEDQECYSACAIMFMMGLAEGPEVRFANRKLHVRGKLG